MRVHEGGYLAGGFEPRSKPVDLRELPSGGTLPEDWDQFCKISSPPLLACVMALHSRFIVYSITLVCLYFHSSSMTAFVLVRLLSLWSLAIAMLFLKVSGYG